MTAEDALFQKFGKSFAPGTVLFREGDIGKEMFVIQAGRVAISKQVRDVEKVLATLDAGEFFGEMAIISNRPRNATATVEDEARLLVIDPRTFEAMIRGNSEIAVRMIKKLADRLSEADAQIETLLLADPASRVVNHLLSLAQQLGNAGMGAVRLEFAPREWARNLGLGESNIREMVARLGRNGLLTVDGDQLEVREVGELFEVLRYLEMKWKFGDM